MTPAQFKRLAALDALLPPSFELPSRVAEVIDGPWLGEKKQIKELGESKKNQKNSGPRVGGLL